MDKTSEYEWVARCIQSIIKDEGDTFIPGLQKNIKNLRTELQTVLETENTNALHGQNTIPDDILRRYISITRDIRSFWFDNVDTHLLTIEHLSDQILCRRRAYEKARKSPSTNAANAGRAVIQKPAATTVAKDSTTAVLQDIAKLNKDDLMKVLAALAKK